MVNAEYHHWIKPTDEHQFCPKCGFCIDCDDCAIWGCGKKEDQDDAERKTTDT
jgi:hypothetical protein